VLDNRQQVIVHRRFATTGNRDGLRAKSRKVAKNIIYLADFELD